MLDHPTKTPGKTTPKLDLAFKNLTFQGKVEGKALFSFGDNAASFKVLSQASPGEVYEIDVVKNAAGYLDWKSAIKAVAGAAPAALGRSTSTSGAAVGTAVKSTYATSEERAQTQIYIVRQSSIGAAIESLMAGAKAPPKVDEILSRAKEFEQFVFGDSNSADVVDKGTEGFKDLEGDTFDDIPM